MFGHYIVTKLTCDWLFRILISSVFISILEVCKHRLLANFASGNFSSIGQGNIREFYFLAWLGTLNLDGGFWSEKLPINGFPIQILLPKSKEERTEVISRLLPTFITCKLQEHLNFSELFQYIFILVTQLCHEFRKHLFNHILKVCKALLNKSV